MRSLKPLLRMDLPRPSFPTQLGVPSSQFFLVTTVLQPKWYPPNRNPGGNTCFFVERIIGILVVPDSQSLWAADLQCGDGIVDGTSTCGFAVYELQLLIQH